ncbi:AMP-binding protein [Nocardioides zeae]|uniref:AMP-binding protein n=1 Tax=Nocardioides imazamoxiresistens TaxID=3231893 RepID=A0ABU3PQZ4_9ACTN|nr:AMP-binding protein [Nocardioides zeae]MDT9591650.1 AMP-binding protein [Nocardioides zeae]
MTGISQWARHWARFGAERPALLADAGGRTWGELERGCAEVAAGFHAVGVRHGDRVGGLMRNAPEHFEVVLACARIGAVFVPLNPLLTAGELRDVAGDADLAAVVTDTAFLGVLGVLEELVGAERVFFVGEVPELARGFDELRGHGRLERDLDVSPEDPLMICYTSGTTGRAKGAVLTHANMEGVAASAIAVDALGYADRAVVTVPLAFTGAGVSFAIPFLRCGGSILVRDGFDPARLLDDIEHHGVSFVGVVPVILERLAAEPGFADRDLSGLRVAKAGGAAVPEHLLRLYHDRGVGLVNAYGLTEGSGLNLELQAHEALRRLGSVGQPLWGQEARVVGADGRDCAPGEPGELLLGGTCVLKEYWRNPAATADTIRDGWLHTGDLATVDEDGYFRIVDRSKDMIISGGLNVYPAEVESALASHPDVVEVAVVGVPDERWGETPVACVVSANPDLGLADLTSHVEASLATYKRPTRLELRHEPLPRGMSGKILKRELRAELVDREPSADAAVLS